MCSAGCVETLVCVETVTNPLYQYQVTPGIRNQRVGQAAAVGGNNRLAQPWDEECVNRVRSILSIVYMSDLESLIQTTYIRIGCPSVRW